MKLSFKQKDNGMYILSKNDLENIAEKVLEDYSPINLQYPVPLNTKEFLEGYLGLNIKQRFIGSMDSGILGLIVMNDIAEVPSYDEKFNSVVLEETYGTVLISPWLMGKENLPRKRYTEIHEAAHFILHKEYYSKKSNTIADNPSGNSDCIACRKVEIKNSNTFSTDDDWMEWQADYLAAALLMPKRIFIEYAKKEIISMSYFRELITPHLMDFKYYQYTVIPKLASAFNVSFRAVQIRLSQLNVLKLANW